MCGFKMRSLTISLLLYVLARTCAVLKPRVLVLGGSGRVGGSAVRSLCERYGDKIALTVGGRSEANWVESKKRLATISSASHSIESVSFLQMDAACVDQMRELLPNFDLTIHTAGPFQGMTENFVLKTCLENGKKYIDVCDDINLARLARSASYQELAKSTGGSAIISTGIWPGGSSLLAQEAIESVGGGEEVDDCTFTFFTAGSGGAGQTILTATFLLLGEDVLVYRNGQATYMKSATDKKNIDFGPGIGEREVVRLNLIECESCFASSKISNVSTFFGTAPPFWNTLFFLMASLIPQGILKDRRLMTAFAAVSLPMVRLVDALVGSKNGIRVDLKLKNGKTASSLLTHNDLEAAVGDAIGSFALQILSTTDHVKAGVFFPEEVQNAAFRREILSDLRKTALHDQPVRVT